MIALFFFPRLDGTPLPPPPAQRSRVLNNCLELCMLYIYIVVPVAVSQAHPALHGEASVDLWEIDRLPRMHIVADRSSEKDNVHLSHVNIVSYSTLFLWDSMSASRR